MYRHIIWDMGGTLVDSYPQVDHTLAQVAYGTDRPSSAQLGEVRRLRTTSIAHAMSVLAEIYGADLEDMRAAYKALKDSWKTTPAPTMSGARAVLEAVRELGGLNLVVTHRDRDSAQTLLDGLGLAVDDMVCAPDGYPRKPDPAMFITLLKRHNLDPATVISVGDRQIDVEAAHAAGLTAFLLDHRGEEPGTIADLRDLRAILGAAGAHDTEGRLA